MSAGPGLRHALAVLSVALLSSCTPLPEADPVVMAQAQISSPLRGCPALGQSFSLPCKGFSPFPESIMYWLANGSFVSAVYPSGAVREAKTTQRATGAGLFLTRNLTFHSFTPRDWHTTFECIILDPASVARKTVSWVPQRNTDEDEGDWSCKALGPSWE